MYGSDIWDVSTKEVEDFCIAWRKGARKVWALPNDTSCDVLYLIANVLPVFDEICRRVLNFIRSCCNSESQLIKYVANFGVNCAKMYSPIGRNALFCSLRYNIGIQDVCSLLLTNEFFNLFQLSNLSADKIAKARSATELLLIRDNYINVPGFEGLLVAHELNSVIKELVTT